VVAPIPQIKIAAPTDRHDPMPKLDLMTTNTSLEAAPIVHTDRIWQTFVGALIDTVASATKRSRMT